jgi:F0F1-type ATP synthase beta subunit
MFVSETFTNKKGEYSSREETLKGIEQILNGNDEPSSAPAAQPSPAQPAQQR